MVPTHPPGIETTVTVGKITSKPKNISLYTPICTPLLQCTDICIHQNGGFNPQKTDTSKNIHRVLQKIICTRHIFWTLPMLELMGKWDTRNKSFRDSNFQTQIHHKSNRHSIRRCHCSIHKPSRHTKKLNSTPPKLIFHTRNIAPAESIQGNNNHRAQPEYNRAYIPVKQQEGRCRAPNKLKPHNIPDRTNISK